MASRVFLHIGAPKTGTTALQTRLHRNAATLLEHGVLVPMGARGERRPAGLVLRAALDLTGKALGQDPAAIAGSWQRLVGAGHRPRRHRRGQSRGLRALRRGRGGAGPLRARGRGRARRGLHRPRPRPPAGLGLGGGSQERAPRRPRRPTSRRPAPASCRLRAAFDVPAVLGRWLEHLPPERVHLVTVPPPGGDRSLLWRRFADLLGIDDAWVPGRAEAHERRRSGSPRRSPCWLSTASSAARNKRGGPHQQARAAHRRRPGPSGRDQHPGRGASRATPRGCGEEVERGSPGLTSSGIDVVGDLDDLRAAPVDPTRPGSTPPCRTPASPRRPWPPSPRSSGGLPRPGSD